MGADSKALLAAARAELAAADAAGLDQVKSRWLGRQGRLGTLLRGIKELPAAERQEAGRRLNELRTDFEELLAARRSELEEARLRASLAAEAVDVTLPGGGPAAGARHPLTLVTERACAILGSMGFAVADGPEIEDDFHNFEALNHPPDHPARSLHDTFYLADGRLLRTHTSSVQIRHLERHPPPVRVIAPGRVYRIDNDATHSPMFHQIEGLWIDNLKGLLLEFFREFFADPDIETRFRPSYFPFTEPSAEVDIRFGKDRWLEVAGCGMVHPKVLENCGVDSEAWQGFAFGTGIDRLAMLRYGLDSLRDLYENDLRLLRQFV
ncbi:MAG: phenylalanine--tRNA ligase subunit alpha [Betaproteobacteria bacterium AqS2]|uniref:Phenylalanine--tRNA ligase alpha subunit n=1 Tax=Candidatus Amphirhobacter heronislandensis TaxID=1732024 RepID=A0A930UG09_9GAMM|nr:phenylalanine--tRNA ligase subunit alpha [Betaproteobacteria bacterium AqS2]